MDPVPRMVRSQSTVAKPFLMVIHPSGTLSGLRWDGCSIRNGRGFTSWLEIGAAWSVALRRWILLPGFLTIGIILGGWWSYEVLAGVVIGHGTRLKMPPSCLGSPRRRSSIPFDHGA